MCQDWQERIIPVLKEKSTVVYHQFVNSIPEGVCDKVSGAMISPKPA